MTLKQGLLKSGLFLFIVLTLSTCMSKSAIEISFVLLLLVSIPFMIRYEGRGYWTRNPYVIILLLPLAIGFCSSFFSLAGPVKGATVFLERYRFFLMIVPFTLFVKSERSIHILFVLLNLSAFISVVYGFNGLSFPHIWEQAIGFYPILRQASLLMSIVLINLVGLFGYRMENRTWNIAAKVLIGANTLLMLVAVILMMRRSAYIGFVAGVFVLPMVIQKRKILTFSILLLCVAPFFFNSGVTQRVQSIVDFKNDHSNRERIQLLRTGSAYILDERLFFHGTGGKMSRDPYTEYFYSHPPEYQEENIDIIRQDFFGNFHNSFLQMAVEYGLFFVLCYLASIFYMLVRLYRSLPHLTGSRKVYPLAAIVITVGFFVSQFFHTNLYSYGGLPFLLAFAAGCHVTNRYGMGVPKTDPDGISNAATKNDGY
jgi:hypothetical protein